MLTKCTSTPKSLFSGFYFAIFTFETTGITSKLDKWQPSAEIVTTNYPGHSSRTCLVGTKLDCITSESDEDIILQCLPASVAYRSGLKYISSSSLTGTGIREIATYVGQYFNYFNISASLKYSSGSDVSTPFSQYTLACCI